jgi:hypothetical protein
LEILLTNHDVISTNIFDLGKTDTLLHKIALNTEDPVYIKQFKIPDTHCQKVEKNITKWQKLGMMKPGKPLPKKNKVIQLVQDFSALNAHTQTKTYSMKDVRECIGNIGQSWSMITTNNHTALFWKLLLHPRARPYTAFTILELGQFQWVTTPMGLHRAPASFQ